MTGSDTTPGVGDNATDAGSQPLVYDEAPDEDEGWGNNGHVGEWGGPAGYDQQQSWADAQEEDAWEQEWLPEHPGDYMGGHRPSWRPLAQIGGLS